MSPALIAVLQVAAIVLILVVLFWRHERRDRQDRADLLAAQAEGMTEGFKAALDSLKAEVERMTTVFDSMGDAYTASLREWKAERGEIAELIKTVEEHRADIDGRVRHLEAHPLLSRVGDRT